MGTKWKTVTVWEGYVKICKWSPDPFCCAALLDLLEYLSTQEGCVVDDVWIRKSHIELRKLLLKMFGNKKITDGLRWLVDEGFLSRRNDPDCNHGRRFLYRLNQDAIKVELDRVSGLVVQAV